MFNYLHILVSCLLCNFLSVLRSDAPLIGLLLHFRIYTENIILIERWKEANQFNQNMKINSSRGRSEWELRSRGVDKSVLLHDAWLSARCLIRVKSQFLINDMQTALCKVLWGLSTFWSVASNWSVTAESAQLWPINISLGQKNHLISSRASPQLGASLDTVDI